MWRLAVGLLAAALLAGGCKRKERMQVETVEEPFTLKSNVVMSDPRAAVQLVNGFYDIEHNAWRWTAGKFAVNLRPPTGAAQNGANLVVNFSLPETIVQRLNAVTLTAKTGSTVLGSETYSKPGEHTFRKAVPASALAGEAVVFQFELDKSLPPGSVDHRELGVIATSAGLQR